MPPGVRKIRAPRPVEGVRTRLTKLDWQIINTALALLEADAEDWKPGSERRVLATRMKVHERLAAYADPYDWDLYAE